MAIKKCSNDAAVKFWTSKPCKAEKDQHRQAHVRTLRNRRTHTSALSSWKRTFISGFFDGSRGGGGGGDGTRRAAAAALPAASSG